MSRILSLISEDVKNQAFQIMLENIIFEKDRQDPEYLLKCEVPLVFTSPITDDAKHLNDMTRVYRAFFQDAADRIEVLLLEKGFVAQPGFCHMFSETAMLVVSKIFANAPNYEKYLNPTEPEDGIGERYVEMKNIFAVHMLHGFIWAISTYEWVVDKDKPSVANRGELIEFHNN